MMERYYLDFKGPKYTEYRKQLIPFAKKFHKALTSEGLEFLKITLNYLKPFYNSIPFAS